MTIPIWVKLMIWTWIPALELRASIPVAILHYDLHWAHAFGVCVLANALLAIPVWGFTHFGAAQMRRLAWFERLWERIVERARTKLSPLVDRWGFLGVALFIAVPLPGSGVYTGLVGAYVLGVDTKRAMLAAVVGVILAGSAVTAASVSGGEAWQWLLNTSLLGGE